VEGNPQRKGDNLGGIHLLIWISISSETGPAQLFPQTVLHLR